MRWTVSPTNGWVAASVRRKAARRRTWRKSSETRGRQREVERSGHRLNSRTPLHPSQLLLLPLLVLVTCAYIHFFCPHRPVSSSTSRITPIGPRQDDAQHPPEHAPRLAQCNLRFRSPPSSGHTPLCRSQLPCLAIHGRHAWWRGSPVRQERALAERTGMSRNDCMK